MATWRAAGDVLRWWRTGVLGWTQKQTADRLSISPTTLSNWERGDRAISLDGPELDELLEGDGVLAGLLWAQPTPEGLDPGRLWTKVFPGPCRPVWLWVRSPTRRLVVQAEWGVTRIDQVFELGPNGMFITVAASLPDSPVVVHFSDPVWADFGTGALPTDIPGAEVVDALLLMERSSADGALMDMFSTDLEAKVASGDPDVRDLDQSAPGAIASYTGRRIPAADRVVPQQWPPAPEGIEQVERLRFARLRTARGISRETLAERLADETAIDIGRDTLRRFETDVGRPHDPLLPVALDHILGAGGRLAVLELRAGSGDGAVQFPHFWRGPIWIRLEDTAGPAVVQLQRGKWHREVTFDEPTVVSAHWFEPANRLRITAKPTTSWAVGVGRRAGVTPIDQNWVPGEFDVAQQAVKEIEDAIFTAVDNRRDR